MAGMNENAAVSGVVLPSEEAALEEEPPDDDAAKDANVSEEAKSADDVAAGAEREGAIAAVTLAGIAVAESPPPARDGATLVG